MTKDYSHEVKGMVTSYRFTDFEKKSIAQGLKVISKRLERKIEAIKNHRLNEGQAKYQIKIESLRYLQDDLNDIIKEFS